MPGTVNGIGTAYRGRKNLKVRSGVCDHCHKVVPLESYETRLCFVVLFVPVIPLGRKQIIDSCPACTWHRALPLGEWQSLGRKAVAEAGRNAAEHPDDPDAAIELHATLSGFQRPEEAEKVAKVLAENFPGHAGVQLYLGSWHAEKGRNREADACFARALELEPDNRAARRAVAIGCIEQGDPDKARRLVAFMETGGREQDPGVLLLLADAFQARGDHQQALELYEIVLRASPRTGQDRKFRQRVARSEAALGRVQTVLPKRPFYRRRSFLAALGGAAAAVLFFLYMHFVANQPVHVVNRLPVAVQVTFDGGDGPHAVAPGGSAVVRLGMGQHRAKVARDGAEGDEVEFDMQAGAWDRMRGRAVFVFNVDGAGDFLWQRNIYSRDPVRLPPDYHIYFGKRFFVFDDIDYALGQEFPETLKVSEHTRQVSKTRVSVLPHEPAQVLAMFPPGTPMDKLLEYAEHHLAVNPGDEALVQIYAGLALSQNAPGRVADFLGKRLDYRPVAVEWHRMYQEACQMSGKDGGLAAVYDAMLSQTPGDSALLYLRGRVALTADEGEPFFDRAIAADPGNAYPRLAKAYQFATRGDFAAARQPAAEAFRLKPEAMAVAHLLKEIRLALGEYGEMETEIRRKLQDDPTSLRPQEELLVVLGAAGKLDEASQAHQAFAQAVSVQLAGAGMQQDPSQRVLQSEMVLQYLRGEVAQYQQSVEKLQPPGAAPAAFAARIELGRPKEAEEALTAGAEYRSGLDALVLSLAWKEQGDQAASDRWFSAAVEKLKKGSAEDRRIAAILENPKTATVRDLDNYTLERVTKSVMLAALADRSPDHRAELLAAAEKLNLPGLFPHRFLKRRIAAMKQ